MKRSLFTLALLATTAIAASANAQIASHPVAKMPHNLQLADALGPRSVPNVTVAQAVARTQIERQGYSSVRELVRSPDGSWSGMARSPKMAAVLVSLDPRGQVTEIR